MLHIALCDDDRLQLSANKDLVQRYLENRDIAARVTLYENPTQLLWDAQENCCYDIYILDIIMSQLDGIELGKSIRRYDTDGIIIYLTASRERAIDSFDAAAFHYLTKPVNEAKLDEVLDHAIARLDSRRDAITVKTKSGFVNIRLDELYYTELSQRSVLYVCKDRSVLGLKLTGSFRDAIADLLQDERFALCGASFAVNLYYVKQVSNSSLTLENGDTIHIPRGSVASLSEAWSDYWLDGRKR